MRPPAGSTFAATLFHTMSNVSWLLTFGEPGLTFVESTAVGDFRERRVLFKDGRDVDFSVVPAAAIQQMLDQQVPVEIADVFSQRIQNSRG